ncbi:MAG: SPOR domain-containing protein [Gemmatimonadetes bacterium]|nr:SPOR domain-containing protein [Gemmatimonadota bacterium]
MVTYAKRTLPFLPLLVGLQGCSPGASNPIKAAMAEHRGSVDASKAVVFRFAGERGADARLYVLPRLDEAAWRFRTPGLAVERMVGFSRDQDEVYLLTPRGELTTLDLATGRARVIDTSVVAAAMGPTGVLHLVRRDGSVGALSYRTVTPWPGKLDPLPETVWGGGSERLVAVVQTPRERQVVALSAGKPQVTQGIPNGPTAVSSWGDLAVVAVDSGLVVLDPGDATRRRFHPLADAPDAVGLSPSEHRIYVATAGQELLLLDRTSLEPAERLRLPGRASALRVDPLGRLLLIRPASGDSIWLVDPAETYLLGTLPASWRDDLPAVAPDGSILVAYGRDIEAYAPDSLTVGGRVAAGARDRWLAAAWDPRRPALQLAADTTAAAEPVAPGQAIYVQVSSTANEAWAQESARHLRTAGMQAGVLPPTTSDEPYRVVLGPYPTREAAETAGRKLGRPFWIFTREGQEPPR